MERFVRPVFLTLLAALLGFVAPSFADTTISSPTTFTTQVENGSGDTFTITDTGVLTNESAFTNDLGGQVDNAGTLSNTAGGAFDNAGAVTNNNNFINETGASLTNTAGGVVTNSGLLENHGFLDNEGALSDTASGNVENYGVFSNGSAGAITNNNNFVNNSGATLTNTAGGVITSDSFFQNNGFIDNEGTLSNTAGAELDNFGGLVNGSTGILTNNFVFLNEVGASLTNTAGGAITNNDSLLDYGFIDNEGTVTNTSGDFDIDGGTFINDGTFSGGQLTNETGGTLVNRGSMNLGVFTQDASSKLVLAVSPKAAAGLTVGGAAYLAGTLQVAYAPGIYTDRSYTLLTAGSISGAFGTVQLSSPYATGTLEYLADPSAVLEVTSLEISPDNDAVFGALGNLALVGAQRFEDGLLGRLDGLDSDVKGTTGTWEDNYGYSYHLDRSGPVAGYDAQGCALAIGKYQCWGSAVDGFAVTEGTTGVRLADGENGTVMDPGADLYGGLALGPVDLNGAVGFAYEGFSTARPIASVDQTASSNYGGGELSTALRAELPMQAFGLSVRPSLGLDYAWVYMAGFAESGAEYFNLAGAGNVVEQMDPSMGLSVEKSLTLGSWSLRQSLDVGWSYETLDQDLPGSASVGGVSFPLQVLVPSPGILTVGGALEAWMNGSFSLEGSWHVAPAGNALAQSLSLGVQYAFGQ